MPRDVVFNSEATDNQRIFNERLARSNEIARGPANYRFRRATGLKQPETDTGGAACTRDPMWFSSGHGDWKDAADGNATTTIVDFQETELPGYLSDNNGVSFTSSTGIWTFTLSGWYRIDASLSVRMGSSSASRFAARWFFSVQRGIGGVYETITSAFTEMETETETGDAYIDNLHFFTLIEASVNNTLRLRYSWDDHGGEAPSYTIALSDVHIIRLIDCGEALAPPVPPDLCDFTTLAYLWESDQNYVVGATNVWSVSDASCTSGITFERAVATAPTNTGTINSIAVLNFDGTQLLDMVGATNLDVSSSVTLKEIWLSWKHTRKNSTLVEYVLRGDAGGIDGIGRNEYGYLQIEMTSVETEFGNICLADGLPHVLRIEVTAANTYRVTLDNYHTQTLDTTNDIAIDGIGQAQGATLDFEGDLMDLYFAEALSEVQAAQVWNQMLTRIGASPQYFSIPDPLHTDAILLDEFLVDDAAPVTTPRTCEPGPGTLTWDTGDEAFYGIAGQQLQLTGSGTTSLTRKFSGGAQTRQLGLRMEAHCEMTDATQAVCFIGWMNSQSGDTNTIQGGFYFSNDINSHLGYASYMGVTITEEFEGYHVGFETDVFVSVVLRAAGFHVFASFCGQLKHIVASVLNSSATVYPGMINANGNFSLDFFRVRGSTYIPTPICSDSFTRGDSSSIGSTDDAGAEETGGQTLAWTETAVASGDAEILSSRLSNQQTTAGDNVFCTLESSVAEITMEATLFLSDWAAVVFNWQDVSNYWMGIMNATDGAGNGLPGSSGAGYLELYEVIFGTATRRGFANTTTINKGDDVYIWAHCDDDTCRVEVVEVTATATSYSASYTVNDRPLKTATKHGLYLDNKVGATAAECSRFVLWNRNVTNYDGGGAAVAQPAFSSGFDSGFDIT